MHGRGDSDQYVREALWGKPGTFDTGHPFYRAIRDLSAIRAAQPALRYGRLYFRPLSGDGVHFGASPFSPGVLAFSRILNNREVLVVANTHTGANFDGHVLVDFFINNDGDVYRVLNDTTASAPGPVETRSGLEIHETDDRITTGPARMMRVSLRPMQVQIIAR